MATIPLEDFRALGLLQEMNRIVLHPAGFALSLSHAPMFTEQRRPTDAPQMVVAELLDCRTEDAGLPNFAWHGSAAEAEALRKAEYVAAMHDARRAPRERALGGSVQPIPGCIPGDPVSLSSDDATVDLCLALARDAHAAFKDSLARDESNGEPEEDFVAAVLLRCVGPLFARLRLLPGGLAVHAPPIARPDGPPPVLNHAQLARCRWLARELVRLSADHDVGGGLDAAGRPVRRVAQTELVGAEVEEARALAARVGEWDLARAGADGATVANRMEELFSLAQPGMRFWRGMRPDLIAAADIIHARLDAYRAERGVLDRFLAGELAAHELEDPAGVQAALEIRAAPLREELAAIDAERAVAAGALAPIAEALARLASALPTEAP